MAPAGSPAGSDVVPANSLSVSQWSTGVTCIRFSSSGGAALGLENSDFAEYQSKKSFKCLGSF